MPLTFSRRGNTLPVSSGTGETPSGSLIVFKNKLRNPPRPRPLAAHRARHPSENTLA